MNIAILGSTGSIGTSALKVVKNLGGRYRVHALSAGSNTGLLYRQAQKFRPRIVCLQDAGTAMSLQRAFRRSGLKIRVIYGIEGLCRIARDPDVEIVLNAVVGAAGLTPLISAIRAGKKIALANKESLVVAGSLVMREAAARKVTIIPVDSEHSAVFQCLQGSGRRRIRRIILTASGGPFYRMRRSMKKVTVQEALAHPKWKMGRKITIDSATMMNKGLEAIEAHHLFGIPMERIDILIHPQSIIHSMVEFVDGSVLAQLSEPDMCLPIQYAFTFPDRYPGMVKRLRLEDLRGLEFFKADLGRSPCLGLAYRAGKTGGTMPAVLNAANEEAVDAFLKQRITFDRIPKIVASVMKRHHVRKNPDLEGIMEADRHARTEAARIIGSQG